MLGEDDINGTRAPVSVGMALMIVNGCALVCAILPTIATGSVAEDIRAVRKELVRPSSARVATLSAFTSSFLVCPLEH
jgi:hypothetical protein